MGSLYHPEATHDHGAMFNGTGAEFLRWVQQAPASMVTHHFIGNCLFHLDGDEAEGEVYTINSHVIATPQGRQDYVAGGRYLDRYVRAGERWFFRHRKRVVDWTHEAPTSAEVMAQGLARGSAGPDDASYKVLPGLAAALRAER
jgi:hypothetical protein